MQQDRHDNAQHDSGNYKPAQRRFQRNDDHCNRNQKQPADSASLEPELMLLVCHSESKHSRIQGPALSYLFFSFYLL
jgi:hypothetical protein